MANRADNNLRLSGENYWNANFPNISKYSSPEQLRSDLSRVSETAIECCDQDKQLLNLSGEENKRIESVREKALAWQGAVKNHNSQY